LRNSINTFFLGLKKWNKSIKTTSSFVSLLFQAKKAYNEIVEVKKLVTVVTLAILVVGLVLLGLSDTAISIADTSTLDNEVISSISKANNSSASATITITMTTALNE